MFYRPLLPSNLLRYPVTVTVTATRSPHWFPTQATRGSAYEELTLWQMKGLLFNETWPSQTHTHFCGFMGQWLISDGTAAHIREGFLWSDRQKCSGYTNILNVFHLSVCLSVDTHTEKCSGKRNTPPKIDLLVSNTFGLKGSSEQLVVCYFTESSSCSQLVFPPVTIDYNGELESVK